jgi:hypothetical protein
MHVTWKNLDEIEIADLQALVDARARETEVLEFKLTLPFTPRKGQPETADRWIEKGDAIGNEARDEILAEIVAFANANGGTLVLGVQESSEQPREAVGLAPLPQCEELARRLLDAAEDIVEPRLSSLVGRGLPIDHTGDGYVILRVGRSRLGPHRLNGRQGREFYVRRGERAARMDVREIKNLTLELARSDERLEAILNERRGLAAQRYKALPPRPDAEHVPPILVRATALPTLSENIDGLTTRRDLWWLGGPFDLNTGEAKPYGCAYPARDFGDPPRVQLRSLVREDPGLARIVRGDGLVEFVFAREARRISETPAQPRLYG